MTTERLDQIQRELGPVAAALPEHLSQGLAWIRAELQVAEARGDDWGRGYAKALRDVLKTFEPAERAHERFMGWAGRAGKALGMDDALSAAAGRGGRS